MLANPADTGSSYTQSLERLVQDNPQSGLLQVLLARAGSKEQQHKATVYYYPRTLHKIINHPADLAIVDNDSIINSPEDIYSNQNFFSTGRTSEATALDAQAFDNNGYDSAGQAQINDANAFDNNGYNTPVVREELSDADIFDNNGYDIGQQEEVVADEPEQIIKEQTEEPIQVIEPPEEALSPNEGQPVGEIAETTVDTHQEISMLSEFNEPEEAEQPNSVTEVTQSVDSFKETEVQAEQSAPSAEQQQPVQQTPPPIPQYEAPRFNSRFPKPNTQPAESEQEPEYPQAQSEQGIEDEVYDEIVSIEDIGFEKVINDEPLAEARFSEPHVEGSGEEQEASEVLFHQPQPVVEPLQDEHKHIQEREERLIFDSAIGADYLSFDKKLDELRGINDTAAHIEPATPVETETAAQAQPVAELAEPTEQQVSRYNDDKMPYTFMWWLNKTRKEHAATTRPYAVTQADLTSGGQPKNERPVKADELQQQYYENIFSLTSISGVERQAESAAVEFDPNKKEDVIIERFIHTEPQIKPLSADKLDNENKAKKSSEDLNDYVTETLARIYTDQMLYHKAIATYKKLILKFPEKKLYFAAQIEQLEKKTN